MRFIVGIILSLTLGSLVSAAPVFDNLSGDLSVAAGRANYSMALDIPAGVNGIRPEVILSYGSSASASNLGAGFSLNAVSSISRCTATLSKDNFFAGLDTNANARFCIGNIKLVAVDGENGKSGTEYKAYTDNNDKYVSQGGSEGTPDTWMKYTPDGYIYTFTKSKQFTQIASEWLLASKKDRFENEVIYSYLDDGSLDNISYSGMTIDFEYETRLALVRGYSKGELRELSSRVKGVSVLYENNVQWKYIFTYETVNAQAESERLERVEKCYFEGSSLKCSLPLKFEYQAQPDTKLVDTEADRTIIIPRSVYAPEGTIQKFWERPSYIAADFNNNGFPEFCYYKPASGLMCASKTDSSYDLPTVWLSSVGLAYSGEDDFKYFAQPIVQDLNDDSYADVCFADASGIKCALNNKTGGFNTATTWTTQLNSSSSISFNEINQDRRPDLCGQLTANDNYACLNNTGSGFTNLLIELAASEISYSKDISWWEVGIRGQYKELEETISYIQPSWVDVDSDLDKDLCWVNLERKFVCKLQSRSEINQSIVLSSAQQFHEFTDLQIMPAPSPDRSDAYNLSDSYDLKNQVKIAKEDSVRLKTGFRVVDLNADGNIDFCYTDKDLKLLCLINDGTQFLQQSTWLDLSTAVYDQDHLNITLTSAVYSDINFDGLPDLCMIIGENRKCAYNQGNSFSELNGVHLLSPDFDYNEQVDDVYLNFVQEGFESETTFIFTASSTSYGVPIYTTDVNGDGYNEFCYRSIDGVICSDMEYHAPRTILKSITTSWGQKTEINYKPYITGKLMSGEDIPGGYTSLKNNALMVDSVETTSGAYNLSNAGYVPIKNKIFYRYGPYLKNNITGEGFISSQTIENGYRGTKVVSFYQIDGASRGKEKEILSYQNNALINKKTNTFVERNNNDGTRRSLLTSTSEEQRDLNGTLISNTEMNFPENEIDVFGFSAAQTTRKELASGEWSQTSTSTTFNHNVDAWLLGRPDFHTVTHTASAGTSSVREVDYTYDNGILKQEIVAPNSPTLAQTIEYEYHSNGLVKKTSTTAQVDGQGTEQTRTEEKEYDSLGRVKNITNGFNQKQSFTYDRLCGVETATDIALKTVTTKYDFQCRKEKVSNSFDQNETNWTLEDYTEEFILNRNKLQGNDADVKNRPLYKVTEQDVTGRKLISYVDDQGRLIRVSGRVSSVGGQERFSQVDTIYDRYSRKVAVSNPYFYPYFSENGTPLSADWTSFSFDAIDRIKSELKKSAAPGNPTLNIQYVYSGLKTTQSYGSYVKETTLGILGKPILISENGINAEYSYTAIGDLESVTRGQLVNSIKYDERGFKQQQTDPSMGTWTYLNNGFGEVIKQTDAKNQIVSFEYDKLGRKESKTETDEDGHSFVSTWKYNSTGSGVGQLYQEAGGKDYITRDYEYDTIGRLENSTLLVDGKVFKTIYGYDNYSRAKYVKNPDGLTVFNEYDEVGTVNMITMPAEEFTDYNYKNIQGEYQILVKNIIELESQISNLQQMAKTHLLKFLEYQEWATYFGGLSDKANSDDAELLQIAAQHEAAAKGYFKKADEIRVIADALKAKLGNKQLKYKGVVDGQYHFQRKRCAKVSRRLGIARCSRHRRDSHYFQIGELNDIDNLGSHNTERSIQYFTQAPVCIKKKKRLSFGRTKKIKRCTKVDASLVYQQVAEKWQQLGKLESQKLSAVYDLRRGTNDSSYAGFEMVKTVKPTYMMFGTGIMTPITASVVVTDKVWKRKSLDSATYYYREQERYYLALAQSEQVEEVKLVDNIAQMQTDLGEYEDAHEVLSTSLGFLNVEEADLDRLVEMQEESRDNNRRLAIWAGTQRNERGQLKSEIFGNGLYTSREFDNATGLLTKIDTGTYTGTNIRQLEYVYDDQNRIERKFDTNTEQNQQSERFGYNDQNQLTDWTFDQTLESPIETRTRSYARTYTYDPYNGNLTSKTGMGNYHYDPLSGRMVNRTPPDADAVAYQYDNNGNLLTGGDKTLTWNINNKVESVNRGNATVNYDYDTNNKRVKKHEVFSSTDEDGDLVSKDITTYYVSPSYEVLIETINGETLTKRRHNFWVGNDVVASYVKTTQLEQALADKVAYYHRDILGSGELVSGSDMEIIAQRYYTPYGEEIELLTDTETLVTDSVEEGDSAIDSLSYEEDIAVQVQEDYAEMLGLEFTTDNGSVSLLSEEMGIRSEFEDDLRGYTSHENIQSVGLINMNARHYDPMLGIFVSPDSIVPGIDTPMAYNRYAYVNGNPISARDPSGHDPLTVGIIVVSAFITSHLSDNQTLQLASRIALQVYLAAVMGPAQGTAFTASSVAQTAGAAAAANLSVTLASTGKISGENVRGAAWSAVSAVASFGIGHGGELSTAETYAGHALTQGALSHLQGGSFIQGAVAGLAGHAAGDVMGTNAFGGSGLGSKVARTMVAASFGWAAAEATGGDGTQAAIIAATVHLFNSELRAASEPINHRYQVRGLICSTSTAGCNEAYADEVFAFVNKNDVPFSDEDSGEGNKSLIDGIFWPLGKQPIYHSENIARRTSINITLEGHNFHPGDVTHTVHFENGNLYYDMVGTGRGSLAGFNNKVGVWLFGPGVQNAVDKFGM